MKIVIVDDDSSLRVELGNELMKEGYEVSIADNFDNLVSYILAQSADLILLDITLPNKDGYTVCRNLRKSSEVPIIFLTGRDSEMDELYSMSLGGDDFIRKPYSLPILLARIKIALKRYRGIVQDDIVSYKDFTLSITKSKLSRNKKNVELTKHEMNILVYLFRHANETIARADLIEYLWDNQVFIDDNTLSVNITRLRAKLESLGVSDLIKTKYGQGYQV